MNAVRFTEEMTGYVAFGAPDAATGHREGRRSATSLMFHLTIAVDDYGRFRSDPLHEAEATGWIRCPALSADPLPVTTGRFNLFAPGTGPGRTTMRYRLFFADVTGAPLTMVGFKDVGDDPGIDLWRDTTSLYTTLLDGHVDPDDQDGATVRARGILVIPPLSFARQLTTFRGRPLDVARFGASFVATLWRTYAGRVRPGSDRQP